MRMSEVMLRLTTLSGTFLIHILFSRCGISSQSSHAITGRSGRGNLEQNIRDAVREIPPKKMIARFDYDPRESSPNVDAETTELTFRSGDMILIYGDMDDDGFYIEELHGKRGLVPSNFLEPLTSPVQPLPSPPPPLVTIPDPKKPDPVNMSEIPSTAQTLESPE